jgi:hypothetical protein
VPVYSVKSFSFDPTTHTATWTLNSAISSDKLMLDLNGDAGGVSAASDPTALLDGEWTTSVTTTASGDGTTGGHFHFRLDVLPGNANNAQGVNGLDLNAVRNRQLLSTTNLGTGATTYTIFYDVNGSGGINGLDLNAVRNCQLLNLPAGEHTAPAPAPAPTATAAGAAEVPAPLNSTSSKSVTKPAVAAEPAAVAKPVAIAKPAVFASRRITGSDVLGKVQESVLN